VLILRLPHHRWSLPLVEEKEDDRMWWRCSRCPSLVALLSMLSRGQGMEWSGMICLLMILPPLGLTLPLI
jgi:hypothetical protein